MSEVPATATPLTRDATAEIFLPAYLEVFGELPDQNRAELLLAQVWLENANGQSIIQHNWGNLATVPGASDYWRPPWFDLDKVQAMPEGAKKSRYLALHDRMLKGTVPQAFRAFPSHVDGARAWLRLLAKERMRPILDAASSGSPEAFARATFDTGYCADQECKHAGPSYAKLRDQIRAASYFDNLKKKSPVVPAELGLWFWFWGRRLSASISQGGRGDVARRLWGETSC